MEWQSQVGRNWAASYHLTDRSFSGLTQRLLDRIGDLPGRSVLDVGCGAGELSLAIARARTDAQVVGVDISADLIEAARGRGETMGNVRFHLADAQVWRESGFVPDLVVSRHGVMFFNDPREAFANLHAQAAPGAQLLFSCFRSPLENPWASDLAQLLRLPPAIDPRAPGPFAFAEPAYVEKILEDGGWQSVACDPVDFAYVAGMGDDPVGEALGMFNRIGPAAASLRALEGEERAEAVERIKGWAEEHRSGNLVAFGAAAWIVTARKG